MKRWLYILCWIFIAYSGVGRGSRCEGDLTHIAQEWTQIRQWLSTHTVEQRRGPVSDNQAFRQAVESSTAGNLFYHINFGVMKQLTEKYLENREHTLSIGARFKYLFFENVTDLFEKHPELLYRYCYTDYKCTRLGFAEDDIDVARILDQAFQKAALQLERNLDPYHSVRLRYQDAGGVISRPLWWHTMGRGATPDHADIASRVGVFHFTGNGTLPRTYDFDEPTVRAELNQWIHEAGRLIDSIHDRADQRYGGGLFTPYPGSNGRAILAPGVIDLHRNVPAHDYPSYLHLMRQRYWTRFGIDLGDPIGTDHLRETQRLFHLTTIFSPHIYTENEVLDMGLAEAKHHVVVVDLSGQNIRNIRAALSAQDTLAAERHADTEDVAPRLVLLARERQNQASAEFEKRMAKFDRVVKAMGLEGKMVRSGDDAIFYPHRDLTAAEKVRLRKGLADPDNAEDLPSARRVTILEPQTPTLLLTNAESWQKAIGPRLEANGLPHDIVKNIGLGVDLHMETGGRVFANLIITGDNPDWVVQRVTRAAREVAPAGFELGNIFTHRP